jgi:hypothetical protein
MTNSQGRLKGDVSTATSSIDSSLVQKLLSSGKANRFQGSKATLESMSAKRNQERIHIKREDN